MGDFFAMTDPHQPTEEHPLDSTEAVLPYIPFIIPLVGAVMMFLLAFIAVTLA